MAPEYVPEFRFKLNWSVSSGGYERRTEGCRLKATSLGGLSIEIVFFSWV